MASSSKSGHYWTEEETEFMLAKLQECDITKCMDGRKKRNGYLFQRVSTALAEAGYNRTAEQIRVRWKNLKSLYFTIHNRQSGQDRNFCPHFHILDDLLAEHSTAQAGEHSVDVLQGTAASNAASTEAENTDDFTIEVASSRKSGHYWTDEETEFMLTKLQECDIIMCMDGRKTRNGYLFQRVSSALAEAGYDRTAEQIRVRWKNLKSLYFTVQNRQSGQDRKSCPHFHILDDLLGKRPTAQAGDEPMVDTPHLSSFKSEDETESNLSHWSVLQPSETNTLNPLSYSYSSKRGDVRSDQALPQHAQRPDRYASTRLSSANTDYFTPEDTIFSSKSGHYWTEEETEFMLTKLQECDITKCMDGRKKRNGYLFKRVSSALAEAGYNRTAEQIRVRWKNLKSLYFTIQNRQSGQDRKSCPHFRILDDLLDKRPAAQAGEHSVDVLQETADDFITEMASSSKSGHFWTEEETEFMLAKLQECDITKCMDGRKKRNGYLFQRVSSALAEAGYVRTAEQIRMRWKHLKSLYFNIQRHNRQSGQDRKSCPHFHVLNDLLGERLMANAGEHCVDVLLGTAASTAAAAGVAKKKVSLKCHSGRKDVLPLSSLRLLISPLQLMAAALWGVVQHRAVMHYGLLEDFITAVLDIIPELLTHSERNQLVLGLRAKIILDMCQSDDLRTRQNIEPHLKRIDELMNEEDDETSSSTMKSALKRFSEVVNTLLEDPHERDIFYKKSPPSVFGFNFDSAFCTLVKKFMVNLEKGLPVPSLDQTSLWLGLSPPILKECGDILNGPEPLSKLIQHLHDDDSFFSRVSQKRSEKMESKTSQKCKSSAPEAEVTEDDLPSVDVAFVYQRQSGSGKIFSCLVCGQGFGSLFELKRHSISGCSAKTVKEKTSSCGWRKENEPLLKKSEDNPPGDKSGEAESESPEAVQQTWSSDTSEGQICKRSSRKKTCSVCGEVFTSSTDLTSHMIAHTEDSSQNSGQCGEELSRQENGCNMSRKHSKDVDYRQEMTGGAKECSVILEHIPDDRAISSKERTMFSCEKCGQSFLRETFEKHKQKCSQENQRKKRPWITSLPNLIAIKACHVGQSASVNRKQKNPTETDSESQLNQKSKESQDASTNKQRTMKCTLCDETFSNLVLMRTHYYDSHKIRESFQCPVCKRVFVRLSDLVKHHQSKLLFQCDTCKRCFVSFFQLNNHRKIYNDACDKSFTGAVHLKKHKNADKTKERPVCSYCGKNFCNKSALQIHMNRHTGGFSCPICAKVFFQKTALQRHMDRHNGQEPYLCELCGKGWATKAYLKIHMVTHSEERPFTCDQCGMAFKREGPLKDHIISKHTEHRPFKCNVCSKAFKVKCILREHMKRHAGVRPFVCPRCGKSYQKRYELKIHKEKFCL